MFNKVDVTYLPILDLDDPIKVVDQVNLRELEDAYYFTMETYGRSFCTYMFLIPMIPSPYGFPIKFSTVIDFPNGGATSAHKVFDSGRAFELCKKASGGELDVVLNPELQDAKLNILAFTNANIKSRIPIKYIIELGHLGDGEDEWERVGGILSTLNKSNCSYVKTNTGRGVVMSFEEKLGMCKKLRELTDLPIKVSGGIKTPEQCEKFIKALGGDTIFGVSYKTLLEW